MEWFGFGQGRYGFTMTDLLNRGEILPIFLPWILSGLRHVMLIKLKGSEFILRNTYFHSL
jgi:hypothetical protein